jgi:predicted anti-sigma-YlaC factor YlaD
MFCDEVLDSIEAIAAGELVPEGRIAHHLATCRLCAAALDSARQVERLLRARATPRPPTNFTTRTMTRVRRARWRSEQRVDAGFNTALALIVVGIAGAVWALVNRTGLTSVGSEALGLFTSGVVTVARRVAPALPMYGAATVLVAAALGIWWWAERNPTV